MCAAETFTSLATISGYNPERRYQSSWLTSSFNTLVSPPINMSRVFVPDLLLSHRFRQLPTMNVMQTGA